MLRYLTAGESHGRALVVILEGVPAGLLVTAEDIQRGLARRRLGFGRGPRMRFEVDEISLVGGVRHGRTLGSPIAIEIANTEWPKWEEEMSPAPGLPSKVLAGFVGSIPGYSGESQWAISSPLRETRYLEKFHEGSGLGSGPGLVWASSQAKTGWGGVPPCGMT